MNVEKLLKEMTVEEKAALVSGTDFMFTNPIPRLGVPSLCFADGPHGLRKQTGAQENGIAASEPATSFPTAATAASSWNPENIKKMGEAIAEECLHYGVNVLLGPGVNIKRNPLCGRNFEYFSEDPLLTGQLGAAEVEGIQSKGVGVSVKHFALNNAENYRFMGNSIADMRAIREIYLKAFEPIVKETKPDTMMCAYNKINDVYCSENKWLMTDVLRGEWGFDGIVMSDWGAVRERIDALKAGLDLEMPGDTAICRKRLIEGIASGSLPPSYLDAAVSNMLKLIEKCALQTRRDSIDWEAHHKLAAEIAADSAVLLQNDGSLPLDRNDKFYVVGDLFDKMRYQGAGSSMINPTQITTPKDAFDARRIDYEFFRGYAENKFEPQAEWIEETVSKAKEYDKVLVFAGLTDSVESEGGDRENMRLPANQLAVIDALIQADKKIIVVLFGGAPMELPFAEHVSAILNLFLPGQNGGTATAALLFGDLSPSGKLAETWARTYADVPFGREYSQHINEIYRESIYVGYRYYLSARVPVRYPFGYGLSYTSFAYRNLQVERTQEKITVSCEIANTGSYDGAEIVQLYVKAPESGVFKPEKELRSFQKIFLKAGEEGRVEMTLDTDDLSYWNIEQNKWALESGRYELQVCSNCLSVKLSEKLEIVGESIRSPYSQKVNEIYSRIDLSQMNDEIFQEMSGQKITSPPALKPIHLESRFTDIRRTFLGRILFNAVFSVAGKQMRQAKRLPEGREKDNKIKGAQFLKKVLESNSIRTMSMSGAKSFPYNFAQGFVAFANGHLFQGIKCFCTKIKAPKLPKEGEDNGL